MATLTGGNPTPGLPDVPDDIFGAMEKRFGTPVTQEDPPTEPAADSTAAADTNTVTSGGPDAPADPSPNLDPGDRTGGADPGDGDASALGASPSPDLPAGNPDPGGPDPGAPGDPGDPGDELPPAAMETYRVKVRGNDVDLTQQQIEAMVALANWANGLPPEQAAQMAALTSGQAVAVSRDEYLRLQQQASRPASASAPTDRPDLSYVDEETRQYIARLEAASAQQPPVDPNQLQLPGTQDPTASPQYQQAMMAMIQQEIAAKEQEYAAAVTQWRAQRPGLSDEDFARIESAAANAQTFRQFHERGMQYAPNGELIYESPVAVTAAQALDFTLAQDPALFTRAMSPAAPSTPAADDVAVARKKANAGSLAAIPAPAVAPPASNPVTMSKDETVAGMAAMIRQMEGRQ